MSQDTVGRDADRPSEIPARGWWDVLKRVKTGVKDANLSLVAAGVAFYTMLAIFPSIIAVVTIYGLVADSAQVESQLGSFARSLPEGAGDLVVSQLSAAVQGSRQGLTIGLVASLAAVVWSASSGVRALITGVNAAYGERESRGFFKLRGLALLLTVGAIVAAISSLALTAAFPIVLRQLGLGIAASIAANVIRWVLLALLVVIALAVLYRYAPDRDNPRWRWVSWGAVVATALWLLGSVVFSLYMSNFGNYNQTYGTLAAVIILLLWLFLSSFSALLGAKLDAEIEHQTARDTTVGPPRPMGTRGAVVADTLGNGTRAYMRTGQVADAARVTPS